MEKPVGSLSRIVYSIKERFSNFMPTDDLDIPDALIEDKVLDVRAILLRDAWKEQRVTDYLYYSTYEKLPVLVKRLSELDPPFIYSIIPALVDKVPDNILYLGSVDGKKNYEGVSEMGLGATEGRRYTNDEEFYTLRGTTITYRNLRPGQKYVRMTAVFYDPRQIPNYSDTEIIVPPTLIEKIEYVVFNDLAASLNIPKDIKDDAADIRTAQAKTIPVQRSDQ